MALRMSALIVHDERISLTARDAIRAASAADGEDRGRLLHSAARILHGETGLDCADVRELVDLPADGGCG